MSKQIPVTRSFLPPFEEYIKEVLPLWESRWLTNMGEKHEELAEKLRGRMGAKYVSLAANGHLALELALESLQLTGEVITTPFTFASTTQAIVRNGLTPVFCDIDPTDFTMDVSKIEPLITPRTSAIVPVHVYGNICNVQEIQRIARKHGLKVIYDGAHAFGEKLNGVDMGNFGDATMFSFHATKVFHTIEGGCVVWQDRNAFERFAMVRNFGLRMTEDVAEIGGNAKMNEFQAAMGLCNLRYLDATIASRKILADVYRRRLTGAKGIRICREQSGVTSNYAYFPIVVDPEQYGMDRNQLQIRLQEEGILTRKYFYPATNDFRCYQGRFEIQHTPVARKISEQILVLPMYAGLTTEDANRICDRILGV